MQNTEHSATLACRYTLGHAAGNTDPWPIPGPMPRPVPGNRQIHVLGMESVRINDPSQPLPSAPIELECAVPLSVSPLIAGAKYCTYPFAHNNAVIHSAGLVVLRAGNRKDKIPKCWHR